MCFVTYFVVHFVVGKSMCVVFSILQFLVIVKLHAEPFCGRPPSSVWKKRFKFLGKIVKRPSPFSTNMDGHEEIGVHNLKRAFAF